MNFSYKSAIICLMLVTHNARSFLFLSACAFALVGCGGSGTQGGSPPISSSTHFILDPAVATLSEDTFQNIQATGVGASGSWMIVATDQSGTSGYAINGTFTAFPSALLTNAQFATVIGAGGTHVWASYQTTTTPANGATGTAILTLGAGTVKQVNGYVLQNTGSTSPDGNTAFVQAVAVDGTPTGGFATLSSSGTATPVSLASQYSDFVPTSHSNGGWTVGTSSNAGSALLISPAGKVTVLGGDSAQPWAVDDSGNAAGQVVGSDTTTVAAKWNSSGTLILLTRFNPASTSEAVNGIAKNGLAVGYSKDSSGFKRAILWTSAGAPIDLTAKYTPSGGVTALDEALAVQPDGKILLVGETSAGQTVAGIVPSKG